MRPRLYFFCAERRWWAWPRGTCWSSCSVRAAQPDRPLNGRQNITGNVGGISALVTGYLIGRTGSYLPGFLLGPVVLMAGLMAYWFVVGELGNRQQLRIFPDQAFLKKKDDLTELFRK